MNTTPIPTPLQVLERYTPLLQLIVEALQKGVAHAHDYARWQSEGIDSALAAAHVRKGAKRFLKARGQSVKNEEDELSENGSEMDFQAEFLPNLGLALNADGIRVRVLKSDRGALPVPGPSRLRQEFYAQQGLLPFVEHSDPTPKTDAETKSVVNLVLHWATDRAFSLERVYLACPKKGGTTRASVEAYWDERIWQRRSSGVVGQQIEAAVEDLDIRLGDAETGSEGPTEK